MMTINLIFKNEELPKRQEIIVKIVNTKYSRLRHRLDHDITKINMV